MCEGARPPRRKLPSRQKQLRQERETALIRRSLTREPRLREQHLCCLRGVSTVGVRELRQNASEILREVEAGEPATVTVAGRPVAQIIPIRQEQWTTWERIRQVFDSPTDNGWDVERREFGAPELDDPWIR